MIKYCIGILFILVMLCISTGYYFKHIGDHTTGDQCIGIGILIGTFIMMPMFIYYRWKGKNVKDYMLTEENIKKMRDFNNDQKK